MKPYTLEKAYKDMNKYHDFSKMVDHYKSCDLQVESFCKSSPNSDLGAPSNTRRSFTNQKKAEMSLHYSTAGNFCETARAFNLNESIVRGIIKTRPVAGKAEPSRCWATFELSCGIRRLAYKMDPCFRGF